jgi:hypothetical protein
MTRRRSPQNSQASEPQDNLPQQPIVLDTNVVSYLFKGDTRASLYQPHVAHRLPIISFMTLAELDACDEFCLPTRCPTPSYPASLRRRNATQPATCASWRLCRISGPSNPIPRSSAT